MRLRSSLLTPLLIAMACENDAGPSGPPALHDRIVFVSTRDGARALYHMRLDGSDVTPIPWVHWPFEPEVSPDGEWITFSGQIGSIWVQRVDGSGARELTQGAAECAFPAWRPDGGLLVFGCTEGATSDLWTVNPDGTQLAPLGVGPAVFPSWSPDGTRIAFGATLDGNWEVYVADLSTMTVENVTESPDVNEQVPRWSPDGQWIAYATDADLPEGPVTLELLDPVTGVRRRPPAYAGGSFVRWTPDSRAVIYARALPTFEAGDIVVQDLESGEITVVLPPDGFEDFSPTYAPPSPNWPRR